MSNKGLLLRQNMTNIANAIRNNGGSILPKEYTELEYIESTGTQWIDTGVYADLPISFLVDFQYTSKQHDQQFGYGAIASDRLLFGIDSIGNFICASRTSYTFSPADTERHIVICDGYNDYAKFDDTIFSPLNASLGATKKVTLMNRADAGGVELCYQKLFRANVKKNNILVRNFIPCYRNLDNEAGLYDLVNGVFYTNAGTGTFIKGSEVASQFKPREMAQGINNLADMLKSYIPHRKTTGNPLSVSSLPLKPKELVIDGDTKQNENPSPDYPQEVRTVKGTNGTIAVNISNGIDNKTIPFTIGNTEFCKIEDTADKLWVNLSTGEYGKTRNIGKYILPSTGWSVQQQSSNAYQHNAYAESNRLGFKTSGVGLSNYFVVANSSSNYVHIYTILQGNVDYISVYSGMNTVEEFTTWLSTHEVILYYPLANDFITTETLGTLSATDLANLRLYAGVNNIELEDYEDNGTDPIIELDYYYDWNELTNALLEMGGE